MAKVANPLSYTPMIAGYVMLRSHCERKKMLSTILVSARWRNPQRWKLLPKIFRRMFFVHLLF